MSVLIKSIVPYSPAFFHFIRPGDRLVSINGHPINDVLDYRFYITEEVLLLEVEKANGRKKSLKINCRGKDPGLEFETYLMDKQHHCANNCIFCFIDQLPGNLRESLYFKDDDSRLSFFFGNYITLTNLGQKDIDRIIDMHISPVNISVHTMNPELRVKMMGSKRAGEVLKYIEQLADAGIKMNTQLVLCPGYNDGEELSYSLRTLGSLFPSVQSIAAVPVGLTCHRDGLTKLNPFTKEKSFDVISRINSYNSEFMCYNSTNIAFAADEFYLSAGMDMPEREYYGDFNQLENGVGLWSLLKGEFEDALSALPEGYSLNRERRITVATGEAAFPLISYLAEKACNKINNLHIVTVKCENYLFGKSITVAGLLCGNDIFEQLKNRNITGELLIPGVSLRKEGDLFLDDMSIEELEKLLNVKVIPVENDGTALLNKFIGK